LARAYAVTPLACAAACAPFKSSPATYATCCKQHAANAPKPAIPQPAATKPVSKVIKSTLPKPPSTTALHQGQMTFYDKIGDPGPLGNWLPRREPPKQPPQNITNNFFPQAPTTTTPSGGGGTGKISGPEVRCQSGCGKCKCPGLGCPSKKCPRLQYGVVNGSDNVDFTVTVKIHENFTAKETATLQVGRL
jgi:hypothetical protein